MSDLTEMERAADREAEAARMASGWMPIESAPRDGTDVLVYLGPERPPVVAGWFQNTTGDVDPVERWWTEYDTQNVVRGFPTHWMPLPAAPGEIA